MPKRRLVKNIDGGGDAEILTSVVSLDIVDSLGERKRLAIAAVGVLVAGAPLTSSGESPGGVTETFSAKAAILIQMHRPARRRAR
jgi:hypothetical protein